MIKTLPTVVEFLLSSIDKLKKKSTKFSQLDKNNHFWLFNQIKQKGLGLNKAFVFLAVLLLTVSFANATDYYSKSTGNLNSIATWGTATDGSGANPVNFTTAGNVFYIRNNTAPTVNGNWTVSGTGSKIVLGDGTTACNFTVGSNYVLTGSLDISSNGTLTLTTSGTTAVTFGNLAANSTVNYARSGNQIILAAAYVNLVLSGSGTKTFPAAKTTITNNLTIATGVVANLNSITTHTSGTLTLGGTVRAAGTWGSTGSAATNGNNTFFTSSNNGIITIDPLIDNDYASYGTTGDVGGTIGEYGGAFTLSAPVGSVLINLKFASYGTPTGTSPNFSLGSCHATTSKANTTDLLGNNSWSFNAATDVLNNMFGDPCVGTTKTYSVVATFGQPICADTSPGAITINGSVPTGGNGIYTYKWERCTTSALGTYALAPGISNGKDYIVPAGISQTTWYKRTITSGTNTSSTIVIVQVNKSPSLSIPSVASISGVSTICEGASTTLTVSGGSLSGYATGGDKGGYVEWFTDSCGGTSVGTGNSITVSPASTTTYYVKYINSCGSTTCLSQMVTVNSSLSLVSIAPNGAQSICATGTGTILAAVETGGSVITGRQWGKRSVSGGAITSIAGQTGSTYTPTGAGLTAGTWYIVCTSTPTCGSAKISNEVAVTVSANLSAVAITPSTAQNFCASTTGTSLTAIPTGGGTAAYQWGKRSISGGAITSIAGQVTASYTPSFADLGLGTCYVVCTSTPTCGSAVLSSNEVTITITGPTTTGVNICQGDTSGVALQSTVACEDVTISKSPGSVSTSSTTRDWNNPTRIYTINNSFSDTDNLKNNSSSTINATNFLFSSSSIPANATINNIEVKVVRKAGSSNRIKDNALNLIVGGVPGSTNLATNVFWSNSTETVTYGSTLASWGYNSSTLTPSLINQSDFGVAYSAKETTNSNTKAQIDNISITVNYTPVTTWYDAASGGNLVESGNSFNPINDPEVIALIPALVNTNTPGTYTFYAECSSNPGCRTPTTFVISAKPTVTFTHQPGTAACINTDVTYSTQSGQTNYVWAVQGTLGVDYSITSGGSNADNTITLKWLTTGSKTVTINYNKVGGCTASTATSSVATIVTTSLSAVTVTPNVVQTICATGTGSVLTAVETGGGLITVRQWGKRSVSGGAITPISSETASTYTPTGSGLGSGTWYIVCTSTPSCGGVTASNEVTVTVNAGLSAVAVTPNGSQPICATGTGSVLTAVETGGGLITSRQWGKRSISGGAITPISSETASTYTPTGAVLGAGTWYIVCSSSPNCGSATVSNEVIINVSNAPAAPTIISDRVLNCSDTSFTLGALTVSAGVDDYKIDVSKDSSFPVGSLTVPNFSLGNTSPGTTVVGGLIAGSTYYARIRAISNCGVPSANSNTVTVSVLMTTYNVVAGVGTWDNGAPSTSNYRRAIFDDNYTTAGQINACSCQINAGKSITIESGGVLKLENGLDVVGTGSVIFENNASLIQTNNSNLINSGNIVYRRISQPMNNFDYSYWSSPVTSASQTLKKLVPHTLSDKYFSWGTTNWVGENENNEMKPPGKGFIIRRPKPGIYGAPYEAVPEVYEQPMNFTGVPNNGDYDLPINNVAGKYNLIGNPYPSALNAEAFLTANSSRLGGTIYFWTHNTKISPTGYESADYATYNLTGGVGTAPAGSSDVTNNNINNNTPSGNIAAGQSFFTSSTGGAGNVIFNNAMRVGTGDAVLGNSNFFRGTKSKTTALEKNRVWLNLTNAGGAFKQMLVGYVTGATEGYDSAFDGESFNGNTFVDFYSINGKKNLTIQGRGLPFETKDQVPLGYRTTIAGTFEINIDHTDGSLSNQPVYVEDKLTNVIYNLKNGPYSFTTAKGTFNDRLVLRYTDKTLADPSLGNDTFEAKDKGLIVSVKNHKIKINSFDETINNVMIYDLKGSLLYEDKKVNGNEFLVPNFNSSDQFLIVMVQLSNGKWIAKEIVF